MLANRKTKIICTVSPAFESKEMMTRLVESGMNIIRLNLSHGGFEEHGNRIRNIREVVKETGKNITILLDTKEPEVRLGKSGNDVEIYEKDDMATIVREKTLGIHEKFHIQCPEIFDDVEVGETILIDDGEMCLTVLEKGEGELKYHIENSEQLKSKKGCNLPGVKLNMPFISPKDDADIRFGCQMGVDYIITSLVGRREDILVIRKILREEGKPDIQITPKTENQKGLDNLEEILKVADGVMVTRGDLSVDVSFKLVPIYQRKIIKTASAIGESVVTATHMLGSMQEDPRPAHAEVSDVADAILDGTGAIMPSGESIVGLYPIEAVQTMDHTAKAMEPAIPFRDRLEVSIKTSQKIENDAIAVSVVDTAMALDVATIIALTQGGTTARRISKFRSEAPVITVTLDEKTQCSLTMNWGVTTVLSEIVNNQNNECELARAIAKEMEIRIGETITIVTGYLVGNGATNIMKTIEVKQEEQAT